jgi:hypothetical protein
MGVDYGLAWTQPGAMRTFLEKWSAGRAGSEFFGFVSSPCGLHGVCIFCGEDGIDGLLVV